MVSKDLLHSYLAHTVRQNIMMLEMSGEGGLLHMRKELRVGKTLRFNFLRQEPVTSFLQVSPIILSFQTRPPNSTTN